MTDQIVKGGEYARRGNPGVKVEQIIVGSITCAYADENGVVLLVEPDGRFSESGEHPYDLIPYVALPPRFTLTEDGCGVLDSERPGWIAPIKERSADKLLGQLNSGDRGPGEFIWTPITRMVPYTRETWPDDAWIRHIEDATRTCKIGDLDDWGVIHSSGKHLSWAVLREKYLWSNSHKKSATWHRCETEERS